jgi:hypothetical protein
VAPLDAEHVVVLGKSVLEDDEDDDEGVDGDGGIKDKCNEMELQVVSRTTGHVLSADTLPLATARPTSQEHKGPKERQRVAGKSAAQKSPRLQGGGVATLLSSFAVPRMDDATELQLQLQQQGEDSSWFDSGGSGNLLVAGGVGGGGGSSGMDALQMTTSLFSSDSTSSQRRQFCDSHLKWDLQMVVQMENKKETESGPNEGGKRGGEEDDERSVDSDDYDLMHHPVLRDSDDDEGITDGLLPPSLPAPPVMVIASCHDAVLAQMRDIDDSISSYLADGKAALALKRGLSHLRQIRQYDIRDLVNEYFRALLKLPSYNESTEEKEDEAPPRGDEDDGKGSGSAKASRKRHLSLRRMKLAAEAMPVLLGGDIRMWNMWIGELEKIPGALFIARTVLPVRGEYLM